MEEIRDVGSHTNSRGLKALWFSFWRLYWSQQRLEWIRAFLGLGVIVCVCTEQGELRESLEGYPQNRKGGAFSSA